MDTTRQYEFSMAYYAFNKYMEGVNTPREDFDPGLQNCFYETFALHAVNLFLAWRDEYYLLADQSFTDEHMKIIAVMYKYQSQVLSYPRKEPSYEDKPTLDENLMVFRWLQKMAKSEGLELPDPNQ